MTTGRSITPRRLARMRGVAARRQPDLSIVIESITDPHNVSAMLRSCDAVGVGEAHLVYAAGEAPEMHRGVAASAQRWIDTVTHEDVANCYATLRARGMTIYATTLKESSCELFDLDLTSPAAFVFGNETWGVSERAISEADATVFIPMMGMVESLNVSVACSVILYEALRQRRGAGMYERSSDVTDDVNARLQTWLSREGRDASTLLHTEDADVPRARSRYENRP